MGASRTSTGEHGVRLHHMDGLRTEAGDSAIERMRTIQQALAPDNTLSPGKILAL